jgi:TRAP transporter TAXI family solute receptor
MRRLFAVGALLVLALSGCADTGSVTPASAKYRDGRLFIATGNTTGVYYQLGGGLADLITKYLPGYEARAEPTGASGENCRRVSSGDMDIAFTLADTAGDAANGKAAFDGQPQKIASISRIYRNYMHVAIRTAAKITKFSDLRGKKVSTGSPNSGTDLVATRMLQAAGMDPTKDIVRQRLSLPETVKGMKDGTTDVLFFTGGLPTPGITDLFTGSQPGQFTLLNTQELLPALAAKYGPVYGVGTLPKATYQQPADVQQIVIWNQIVVSPDMPEQLAYDLARIIFEHQDELKKVHPEGGNFDRAAANQTDPVPLHPGAQRYYQTPR